MRLPAAPEGTTTLTTPVGDHCLLVVGDVEEAMVVTAAPVVVVVVPTVVVDVVVPVTDVAGVVADYSGHLIHLSRPRSFLVLGYCLG